MGASPWVHRDNLNIGSNIKEVLRGLEQNEKVTLVAVVLLALTIAAVLNCSLGRGEDAHRSEVDVPMTPSEAQVTVTAAAVAAATSNAQATSVAENAESKLLEDCNLLAEKMLRVTATITGFDKLHAVTVPIRESSSSSSDSTQTMLTTKQSLWFVKNCVRSNPARYPAHATAVALSVEYLDATVAPLRTATAEAAAPMLTATAQAYAAERRKNATVRSRNVTFRCERLRLAYREVSALGQNVAFRHVANTMMLAPQGENTYFDSYDAKQALQECGQ